jgi:hypothetical protein
MSAINNPDGVKQKFDFTGLRVGTGSATDIDASADYHGQVFFFFDAKYGNTPLSEGQRKHYEALCNRIQGMSIAMVLEHNVPPPAFITLIDCKVRSFYWGGKWQTPKRETRPQEIIDWMIRKSGA